VCVWVFVFVCVVVVCVVGVCGCVVFVCVKSQLYYLHSPYANKFSRLFS